MSRTPSLSGLGRGRARGRRDIVDGELLADRRLGRPRLDGWGSELAKAQSEMESEWKSMEDSAPNPFLGYNTRRESPVMIPESLFSKRGRG